MLRQFRFCRLRMMNNSRRGGFGSSPSFTPPPAAPPQAAPATMASPSVAVNGAKQYNQSASALGDFGTPGGAQGVAPAAVATGKTTLGGLS